MVSSPKGCQMNGRSDFLAGTIFIPALDSELLLMVEITAQVLFFTSHRGDRISSYCKM